MIFGVPALRSSSVRLLRHLSARLFVAAALSASNACVASYTSALGYRARDAALRGDVDAFDELMEEAAGTTPRHPFDNPKKTVLTHFLDLGGSDRFFAVIEGWRKKGWVSDLMTCAIHRARYRGVVGRDPIEADGAADACIDRARAAAADPDRQWEIEACLDEAPFLTETATVAIGRYVEMAADPLEPYPFRAGLLEGMTKIFFQDPASIRANDPAISREEAFRRSAAALDRMRGRFDAIIRSVDPGRDGPLIASSTAIGALEIERVSSAHGRTFLAEYAESKNPALSDLAWAWVRALKHKKRIARLDALGVWERKREPAEDAFWYLCFEGAPKGDPRASGPSIGLGRTVPALSVLAFAPVQDLERIERDVCAGSREGPPLPRIVGPYPLEATAVLAATASVASSLGEGARIALRRRITLDRPRVTGQGGS